MDVLFSEELIQKRVHEVAAQITEDFKGKDVLVIAVLNGSFIFCADLVRNLDLKVRIDFISVGSYVGKNSSGEVRVVSKFKEDIKGKNVLIVEDIVDTGISLDFLIKEISLQSPRSVKSCVLLDKKCARKKEVSVDYVCFDIGLDFAVGYGLDYSGSFRNLPYIGKFKEDYVK